jgi:hypothetical protein
VTSSEQKTWSHTCDAAINRIEHETKLGLFQKFEGKGKGFTDKSFNGRDMLYWQESNRNESFR